MLLHAIEHTPFWEQLVEVMSSYPESAMDVCRACLDEMDREPDHSFSRLYSAAPFMIDISLRLQRLGESLREPGLVLFERLLALGVSEAESTLSEIDGRLTQERPPFAGAAGDVLRQTERRS